MGDRLDLSEGESEAEPSQSNVIELTFVVDGTVSTRTLPFVTLRRTRMWGSPSLAFIS